MRRGKEHAIENESNSDLPRKKKRRIDYQREIHLFCLGLTSNQLLTQKIVEDAYAEAIEKSRQNDIRLSEESLTESFHYIIESIRKPVEHIALDG